MKYYQIVTRDWKYSTFNNFVKNGYYETDQYNFEDKYKITDLSHPIYCLSIDILR